MSADLIAIEETATHQRRAGDPVTSRLVRRLVLTKAEYRSWVEATFGVQLDDETSAWMAHRGAVGHNLVGYLSPTARERDEHERRGQGWLW